MHKPQTLMHKACSALCHLVLMGTCLLQDK